MPITADNFNKVIVYFSSRYDRRARGIRAFQDDVLVDYLAYADGRPGYFDTGGDEFGYLTTRISDGNADHHWSINGTIYTSESAIPIWFQYLLDRDPIRIALTNEGADIANLLEALTGDNRLEYDALRDAPDIPMLRTAAATARLLETLTGTNRFDYESLKNRPVIPDTVTLTGDQVVDLLEALTGEDRLSYTALKDTPVIPTLRTAAATARLLETLTGTDRFDYNSLKNRPTIPDETTLTGDQVVDLLEALTGDDRLQYSAIRGTPTIPTLRTAAETYTLIQSMLDYDDLQNKPTILSETQVNALIAAYGEPFTSALRTKLNSIETNATADQTGAEIVALLEALTSGSRLSYTRLDDTPTIPTLRTAAETYALIQSLLNYNDLQNQPSIPTLRTASETYTLIQSMLNYNDLQNQPTIPTLRTAAATARLLETLTGTDRFDYESLKNKPVIPDSVTLTGEEVVDLLEALTGDERLQYSAIRGTPTIPTLRTAAETYTLIQSMLDYDDLQNKPTILSETQVNSLIAAYGEPFTSALLTKLNGIETGATADQTGAEIVTLLEALTSGNRLSYTRLDDTPTIPTLRTAAQTYALIQSLLNYNDLQNQPTILSETQVNALIAAYGEPFTSALLTKLNGIETGATADQTGAEIADLLEALTGDARLNFDSLRSRPRVPEFVESSNVAYEDSNATVHLTTADGEEEGVGEGFTFQYTADFTASTTAFRLRVNSSSARRIKIIGFNGSLRDMTLNDLTRYNYYSFIRAGSFWHLVASTVQDVPLSYNDLNDRPTIPTLRTGAATADLLEALTGDDRLAYSALRGTPSIPSLRTAAETYALIQSLLNYNDLQNQPTILSETQVNNLIAAYGQPFTSTLLTKLNGIETSATADQTGAEIVTLLEALTSGNRLSYTRLDDTPSIPTLRTASETYTLIQSLLNYNDLSNRPSIPTLRTAAETYALIQSLLNYNDLQNQPTILSETQVNALIAAYGEPFTSALLTKLNGIETSATADQTGAEIVTLLEALTSGNRLSYTRLDDTPTIPTLRTAQQTYDLVRPLLNYNHLHNQPTILSQAQVNLLIQAYGEPFTSALLTKLNGIETGATADQTGAEIVTLLEALSSGNRLSYTRLDDALTGAQIADLLDALTGDDRLQHSSLRGVPDRFSTTQVYNANVTVGTSEQWVDLDTDVPTSTQADWALVKLDDDDVIKIDLTVLRAKDNGTAGEASTDDQRMVVHGRNILNDIYIGKDSDDHFLFSSKDFNSDGSPFSPSPLVIHRINK